jgi:hypothetical protein
MPTHQQHTNTPTPQHTNTPTHQQTNTSTHQQRTNTPTHQHTSRHQRPYTNRPTHQHNNRSYQHTSSPTNNTNRPQPFQGANQGWQDYRKNWREERGNTSAAPNAHPRVVTPNSCCESTQGPVISVVQAAPAVGKGYPPRRTSYVGHARSRGASSNVDYRLRDQVADIVQVKESA